MSGRSAPQPVAWRGDDGSAHYSDGDAGPAGVARLELAGGTIVVTVDYLEPATIVGLDLHDPDDGHLRALATVLGRPSLGHDELPDDGSPRALPTPIGIGLGTRPHPLVALAVVATDIEEQPFEPFALGVALLEAAELVERLPGEARRLLGDVDPSATRRRGARLVLDAAPDDIEWAVGPRWRPRVVELLAAAAAALGGTAGEALGDLSRTLRSGPAWAMPAAALDAAAAPPAAAHAAAPLRLVPPPEPEPEPEGRSTECSFVLDPGVGVDEVGVLRTVGHLDAGVVGSNLRDPWLRVMRVRGAEPPVPLAVAPFGGDGELREAAVLVSDDEIDTDLVVEVTPAPLDAPLAGRLEAVRGACRLGRAALGEERAGRDPVAIDLWLRCAAAWRDLGDDRRADAADERARAAGHVHGWR
jgi:hypothetical protein